MGSVQEQIERLLAKRAELDARLATARATATRQERRNETRRKIIAGGMILKMNGYDWGKVGEQLRAANMLDLRDYPLFGIAEKMLEQKPVIDSSALETWREFKRSSEGGS